MLTITLDRCADSGGWGMRVWVVVVVNNSTPQVAFGAVYSDKSEDLTFD